MLEVIGIKIEDAFELSKSVASQMEYCVDLDKGGLSPKAKDIINNKSYDGLPIRVMVRNHWNNFIVTKTQLEKEIIYINSLKNSYVDGFVWGALTKNNTIDFESLEKILSAIGDKTLTFHKAFDLVDNKQQTLEKLFKYKKIKYVLTSGGEGNPLDNIDFFENVPSKYRDKILIGGGVNQEVIKQLSKLDYKNFHVGRPGRLNGSYSRGFDINNINNLVKLIAKYNLSL